MTLKVQETSQGSIAVNLLLAGAERRIEDYLKRVGRPLDSSLRSLDSAESPMRVPILQFAKKLADAVEHMRTTPQWREVLSENSYFEDLSRCTPFMAMLVSNDKRVLTLEVDGLDVPIGIALYGWGLVEAQTALLQASFEKYPLPAAASLAFSYARSLCFDVEPVVFVMPTLRGVPIFPGEREEDTEEPVAQQIMRDYGRKGGEVVKGQWDKVRAYAVSLCATRWGREGYTSAVDSARSMKAEVIAYARGISPMTGSAERTIARWLAAAGYKNVKKSRKPPPH